MTNWETYQTLELIPDSCLAEPSKPKLLSRLNRLWNFSTEPLKIIVLRFGKQLMNKVMCDGMSSIRLQVEQRFR